MNFTIAVINCILKQSQFNVRTVVTDMFYTVTSCINLIPINQRLSNVVRLITDRARGQLRNLLKGRVNMRFALNGKIRVIARKFD